MFDSILKLPIGDYFGREKLNLPTDIGLPTGSVRLYCVCRAENLPGSVWNVPTNPICGTLRLKISLKGSAETQIGNDTFIHEAGQAILILPGENTKTAVAAGGEPWEFAHAAFLGPEAERLGRTLFARTGRMLRLNDTSDTIRHFENLFRRMADGGFDSPFAESLAAYGILMSLWDDFIRPPISVLRFRMDTALRHLAANTHRNVPIRELASVAGLSESHLHRAFLHETGKTPHRFHLDTRLALARETLRDSPLSVKETAVRYGFSDMPNFTRLFKRAYGTPPSRTRP